MPSNDYRDVKIRDLSPPYDTDPHASCKARLAEEQHSADIDRKSATLAWQHIDEIRASRDWWREFCWLALAYGGLMMVLAVVIAIVK